MLKVLFYVNIYYMFIHILSSGSKLIEGNYVGIFAKKYSNRYQVFHLSLSAKRHSVVFSSDFPPKRHSVNISNDSIKQNPVYNFWFLLSTNEIKHVNCVDCPNWPLTGMATKKITLNYIVTSAAPWYLKSL